MFDDDPSGSSSNIAAGNTQMTRQEILDALEANIIFAKDGAAGLLCYLGQVPSSPEQKRVVQEVQRIQGYLGGVVLQLVRVLRDDNEERHRPVDPPGG